MSREVLLTLPDYTEGFEANPDTKLHYIKGDKNVVVDVYQIGEFFEDIGKKSGCYKAATETDPSEYTMEILMMTTLTQQLISQYHVMMVHPGRYRLYNTLCQHYTWPTICT